MQPVFQSLHILYVAKDVSKKTSVEYSYSQQELAHVLLIKKNWGKQMAVTSDKGAEQHQYSTNTPAYRLLKGTVQVEEIGNKIL